MACIYNVRWQIGVVLEKNEEQLDALIKFMHLSGPTRLLHWPDKEDLCCGFQKQRLSESEAYICTIAAPYTVSGRQYTISRHEIDKIEMKILGAH